MSDVTLTGSSNFDKISKDVDRLSASSGRLGKSQKRAGFAVLEASRALEDFSYVGMRGAINNIPGLIQSLGAGAGLAGAASVVVVAVWKGVEALEAFMNKQRAVIDNNLTMAANPFMDESTVALTKEQNKVLDEYKQNLEMIFGLIGDNADIMNIGRDVEASRDQTSALREQLDLVKQGADEEDRRFATMKRGLDALREEKKTLELNAETSKKKLENTEREIALQEKIAGRVSPDVMENLETARKALDVENMQKFMKGRDWDDPEDVGRATQLSQQLLRSQTGSLIQNQTGMSEAEFRDAAEARKIAVERLEQLREIQAEQSKTVSKTEEEVKLQTYLLEEEAKRLKIKEQITRAEEQAAEREQENKRFNELIRQAPGTDGLLSGMGQRGLAGVEIQSAMDVMDVQRDMLSELKIIRRNTGKNTTATYN